MPANTLKGLSHIKVVDTFKSSVTGRTYRMKAMADYRTTNMVYMCVIECAKCKMPYVRETENAVHIQMDGHQSDV